MLSINENLYYCYSLKWSSLELRRKVQRLTFMYKLINGTIDMDINSFSKRCVNRINTRSNHRLKYHDILCKKDIFFYSFFPRTLREWNRLPKHFSEISSLEKFQENIIEHYIDN
jgi:hypothetical protein